MKIELVSGVLGFFVLCCAYAAQYWAYRCHQELKKIKAKLDHVLAAPLRRE